MGEYNIGVGEIFSTEETFTIHKYIPEERVEL